MVFLWLILLSILLSRSICVASNDRISSFPMLDNIALCISHLPYLYVYWCTFRFFSLSPLLRIMLQWMYRSRLHPSSFVVQLNSKTNLILKMVRVLEYFFFFFKSGIQIANRYRKRYSYLIYLQRNTNLNHSEITTCLLEWSPSKWQEILITRVCKDREKREPLYGVGVSVHWCRNYG